MFDMQNIENRRKKKTMPKLSTFFITTIFIIFKRWSSFIEGQHDLLAEKNLNPKRVQKTIDHLSNIAFFCASCCQRCIISFANFQKCWKTNKLHCINATVYGFLSQVVSIGVHY